MVHDLGGHPLGEAVFQAPTRRACLERALVLQARGIPHAVHGDDGAFRIFVPQERAAEARAELGQYARENVGWPPLRPAPPMLSSGVRGALVYALVIVAVFPVSRTGLFGTNWWEAGKLVSERVTGGESWRAVTALTLHGSAGHLIGNVVFGCTFAVLAAHNLGTGLTWLGTVLAGALGNWLNALIQGPGHASIGASTAVFGCLGLMASYEWVRRHALQLPPMRRYAPLLAGAALLGFLGIGDGQPAAPGEGRTDVVAHLTGLAAGAVLGVVAGLLRLPARTSARAQALAAAAAAALVAGAWAAALAHVH